MTADEMFDLFVQESRELLTDMETALLAIDPAAIDPETVNALFRAAHTIKGSAGLISGLEPIVTFTHAVEDVLDAVRGGELSLDAELVSVLLSCADHVGSLLGAHDGEKIDEEHELVLAGAPLLERLERYLPATEHPAGVVLPRASPAAPTITETSASIAAAVVASDTWHISLRFSRDVLRIGMEPVAILRYLGKLGTIAGIVTLSEELPALEVMDPEACYLGFEIALRSEADKATIDDAFEFVRDSASIRILPPRSKISEYTRLIQELPEGADRIGEILVYCGSITERERDAAVESQRSDPGPAPPIGEILVSRGSVHPEVVEAALAKQRQVKTGRAAEGATVRVDADKLDRLINLVGELIIATASADMVARRARVSELVERTTKLSELVEEVRDSALALRMVKIGATFNRFQRVVFDVSRDLGKDIALSVSGEDTELDKSVVEKLGDPLMHLIRNAMDHGIEAPDVRLSRGKPAKGTLRLHAHHDSGSIVIEVSDDGGGLKRDKILAKAVERGLVEPGRSLSDREIYNLIFEPGFSTADNVSNLSGRGVGMDVVKKNITALRGTVEVESEEGLGTTVVVRLPLTLAIIDGFLVGLGDSTFVVPLEVVDECMELTAGAEHDYVNLRGQVLPFVRLRELFAVSGQAARRENVVVIRHAGNKAGLVVDALLGECQTVVKPLGKIFGRARCISGSSILATGELALILDVPALLEEATQRTARGSLATC